MSWTPDMVRDARKRLGLTQQQLAEILRLAPATGKDTVRSWESGKRPITGPAQVAIEGLLRDQDCTCLPPRKES